MFCTWASFRSSVASRLLSFGHASVCCACRNIRRFVAVPLLLQSVECVLELGPVPGREAGVFVTAAASKHIAQRRPHDINVLSWNFGDRDHRCDLSGSFALLSAIAGNFVRLVDDAFVKWFDFTMNAFNHGVLLGRAQCISAPSLAPY